MKSGKGYKLKRKILREKGKKKDLKKYSMHNRFQKWIFFLNWKEKKDLSKALKKGKNKHNNEM